MRNFQRTDSISNAHVGQAFETLAQEYFLAQNITLCKNFSISIGITTRRKPHAFDLGSEPLKIIVECKSHKWTSGDNVPSAKITVWNEAMFYFSLSPSTYRKILFVLRDYSPKRRETLAKYYIRTHYHLIPPDVEIMEFDTEKQVSLTLNTESNR